MPTTQAASIRSIDDRRALTAMAVWTCPDCARGFGKRNQGHTCAPAMSAEEYFAVGPAFERPVFEAVSSHLAGLGAVRVEFVSVGIFFKRATTFVELRPMQRWVALSFGLARRVEHPRITRVMPGSAGRTYHVVRLVDSSDVDDDVRRWLTEAFELSRPE